MIFLKLIWESTVTWAKTDFWYGFGYNSFTILTLLRKNYCHEFKPIFKIQSKQTALGPNTDILKIHLTLTQFNGKNIHSTYNQYGEINTFINSLQQSRKKYAAHCSRVLSNTPQTTLQIWNMPSNFQVAIRNDKY